MDPRLHGGRNFIKGFSAERQISDVRFEGLRINGSLITSAAAMGLEIGPFVSNVAFVGCDHVGSPSGDGEIRMSSTMLRQNKSNVSAHKVGTMLGYVRE